MKIIWNWKQQRNQVAQLLVGHFGGLGVVLGIESPRVQRGQGGGLWWGCVGAAFYMAVFHVREAIIS